MYWSDIIEIDPTNNYEVKLSIYSAHPDDRGTRYFGFYAYDADMNQLNVLPFYFTRQWESPTDNPYFWNGDLYGGNWRDITAYIIGCNTSESAISNGVNHDRSFKLPSNAKYIRLRFLNYGNGGRPVRNDFYNPSLVKTQLATDLEYEYDKAGRLTSAQHLASSGVVTTTVAC